ncbi:MAG: DivIVA domain-containing protein [Streptosporangiales bacterium]|nr:DivIVA domain-containing protein [Streptosporangiales bacterium]
MPLTPADVRNKQFNTTRLRPGYDEEEVDSFLDEVEAELDRLITENDELRRRLAEVTGDQSYLSGSLAQQQGAAAFQGQRQGGHHSQGGNGAGPGAEHASQNGQPGHAPEQTPPMPPGGPDYQAQSAGNPHGNVPPPPDTAAYPGPIGEAVPHQVEAPKNDVYPAAPGTHAAAGGNLASGLMAAAGGGQVPDSAARLLALAQQVHDEHVATAQQKADEVLRKARTEADKLVSDARRRAEDLDRDSQEKHRSAMGSLITEREKLEQRIEVLRTFEREYRSRLKSYLTGELEKLEKTASHAPPRMGE